MSSSNAVQRKQNVTDTNDGPSRLTDHTDRRCYETSISTMSWTSVVLSSCLHFRVWTVTVRVTFMVPLLHSLNQQKKKKMKKGWLVFCGFSSNWGERNHGSLLLRVKQEQIKEGLGFLKKKETDGDVFLPRDNLSRQSARNFLIFSHICLSSSSFFELNVHHYNTWHVTYYISLSTKTSCSIVSAYTISSEYVSN